MFLNATKISCGYAKTKIISDCNIYLKKGQIASIVGPNGAGKSTAMKAIFGLIPLFEGSIFFNNEDISYLKPQERVLKGMSFVPQTNNIFQTMTVEENLEMGGFIRNDGIQETMNHVYELFPILLEKKKQTAENLSGGQRQQLAFGRALMTNPILLMLDEPSAGVSPIIMDELFKKVVDISKKGVSILMVEQNAKQALKISDIGFVLTQGKNKFIDTGKNLLSNVEVRIIPGRVNFGSNKCFNFICKLYFSTGFILWMSISTGSFRNYINLHSFKIFEFCTWRIHVFWSDDFNIVNVVFSRYWYCNIAPTNNYTDPTDINNCYYSLLSFD